jgi:hypothetical protein
MHLIWRRYSRSGQPPRWFYPLIASGFVSLTVFGLFAQDWLVAAVAAAMVGVTIVVARLAPRFSAAASAGGEDIDRGHA